MSNIFTTLLGILKIVLPFLKTAAEKAFNKLPKEDQDKLIQVSKLVEVIKQVKGKSIGEVLLAIYNHTGLTGAKAETYIFEYLKSKGYSPKDLQEGLSTIWADFEERTDTGIKSLWAEISNIVSSLVSNVDWQALLMGLGEYVYRTYVKGKIKI